MNIMKSTLDESDSDTSLESKDQAIQRRRSSLRSQKQKKNAKSLELKTPENDAESSRSVSVSKTAPSSVATTSSPVACHASNDEMGVL